MKIILLLLPIFLLSTCDPVFAANPKAVRVRTDTTNFNGCLSAADTEAQASFDTLDDCVAAGGHPVADTTGIVKGSADASKIIRFEVDGLTPATTRVLTVKDKDYTIEETGHTHVEANITDLTHTTNTDAESKCTGDQVLEGDGDCVTTPISNATHTGDVTGASALTIAAGAVDHSHLGTDVITGAAAVGTFASGDTFLCHEAGVGVRECDYDDLPSGAGGSDIGSRVTHSTTQSISGKTLTAVAFNTERYDTDTMHDNSTNNSRITFTTAGKYMVGCSFEIPNNDTFTSIRIRLNGSTEISKMDHDRAAVFSSSVYDFSATDYVECMVYVDSSGAQTMQKSNDRSPEFWAQKIDAGG